MIDRLKIFLVLGLLSYFFGGTALAQERRIALVIGNSNYTSLTPLANPLPDADAVSQSLSALGFTVFLTSDLDQVKFRKALRFFKTRAENADTTLLYFAGHGATLGGRSYLFPTDFGAAGLFNLQEAIDLESVLDGLGSNLRSNLVFIDACRDNPLQAGNVADTAAFAPSQGLRTRPRIGTLISFATTPGHIAYDGNGLHSPFTGALLDHLETPAIDIELMLKRVRRDVVVNTQGLQVPWTESSLLSPFQLAPLSGISGEVQNLTTEQPKANPRLISVLANQGFNQKPILQRISLGITPPSRNLPMQGDADITRSTRIRSLLCSVLEPPLPANCTNLN